MRKRQPAQVAPQPPVQFPPTYEGQFREAVLKRNEAYKLFLDADKLWRQVEHARFLGAGGCDHCHGRGWVVNWDTLDHMDGSDASYGPCPEATCTKETRIASGLDISQDETKYFRWHSVSSDFPDLKWADFIQRNLMYQTVVKPFAEMWAEADRRANALHAMSKTLKRGDTVVVVKGRKAPVGTVGVVAYLAEGGGLLIKDPANWQDRKAQGVWANQASVELVVK